MHWCTKCNTKSADHTESLPCSHQCLLPYNAHPVLISLQQFSFSFFTPNNTVMNKKLVILTLKSRVMCLVWEILYILKLLCTQVTISHLEISCMPTLQTCVQNPLKWQVHKISSEGYVTFYVWCDKLTRIKDVATYMFMYCVNYVNALCVSGQFHQPGRWTDFLLANPSTCFSNTPLQFTASKITIRLTISKMFNLYKVTTQDQKCGHLR